MKAGMMLKICSLTALLLALTSCSLADKSIKRVEKGLSEAGVKEYLAEENIESDIEGESSDDSRSSEEASTGNEIESIAVSREEMVEIFGSSMIDQGEDQTSSSEAAAGAKGSKQEEQAEEESNSILLLVDQASHYEVLESTEEDQSAVIKVKIRQSDVYTWLMEVNEGARNPQYGSVSTRSLYRSIEYDIQNGKMPMRDVETDLNFTFENDRWSLIMDEQTYDVLSGGILSAYKDLSEKVEK